MSVSLDPAELARVSKAVARLPRRQRAVLLLCVRHRLGIDETARRLGISRRRARRRLIAALGRLKRELDRAPQRR